MITAGILLAIGLTIGFYLIAISPYILYGILKILYKLFTNKIFIFILFMIFVALFSYATM